jgi:hypothetical protein
MFCESLVLWQFAFISKLKDCAEELDEIGLGMIALESRSRTYCKKDS